MVLIIKQFPLLYNNSVINSTLFLYTCIQDMEHQLFAGVVFGASSLIAGYVLHKLSEMRAQEVSYLHLVPQFHDFRQLKEHLKNSPQQKADVLVEGIAEKLGNAGLYSEKAGIDGAARLVTTTTYTKVYHEESRKWRDMANTMENVNISLPFKLEDTAGNFIRVEAVHNAGGFRQILQRVFQEKILPEKRTTGDYATNITLKEIPNGSLTREFLLVFGSTVAGYGNAVLQKQSFLSSGEIVFTPREVSSSIRSLISRNEMIASTFRFFSLVFVIAGGSILLLTVTPVVLQFLYPRKREAIEG